MVTITVPRQSAELVQAYAAIFRGVATPDCSALLEGWTDQVALDAHAKLNAARPPLRPDLRAGSGERDDYQHN